MSRWFVSACVIATALALGPGAAAAAETPPPPLDPLHAAIAELRANARARDSLTTLSDAATGASHDFYEELVWKRDLDLQRGRMELAERVHALPATGREG